MISACRCCCSISSAGSCCCVVASWSKSHRGRLIVLRTFYLLILSRVSKRILFFHGWWKNLRTRPASIFLLLWKTTKRHRQPIFLLLRTRTGPHHLLLITHHSTKLRLSLLVSGLCSTRNVKCTGLAATTHTTTHSRRTETPARRGGRAIKGVYRSHNT